MFRKKYFTVPSRNYLTLVIIKAETLFKPVNVPVIKSLHYYILFRSEYQKYRDIVYSW
jgi:hypothetical protein